MAEPTKTSRSALAQFIGQDDVQTYLGAVLAADTVSHTYLFLGPRGVGKLPASRAFAQALLCPHRGCGHCADCAAVLADEHPDLLSLEGKVGVDDARAAIEWAETSPVHARRRVVLLPLDETNKIAQNALLKTLEEPMNHTVFVLRATPSSALLPTIKSRAVVLNFHPLSVGENTRILLTQGFSENEAVTASLESGGSYEIAENILREHGQQDFAKLAVSVFGAKPGARVVQELLMQTQGEQSLALAACSRMAYYYAHWLGTLLQKRSRQDDFLGEVISQEQLLLALRELQRSQIALRTTTNQELVWYAFVCRIRSLR